MHVLVKSMLEAFAMYGHVLAHIPKGMLSSITNLCFNFLWRGEHEYMMFHLVKQSQLEALESQGAWDLKNIFHFNKVLATKSLWNLISKEILWKEILIVNSISPGTVLD